MKIALLVFSALIVVFCLTYLQRGDEVTTGPGDVAQQSAPMVVDEVQVTNNSVSGEVDSESRRLEMQNAYGQLEGARRELTRRPQKSLPQACVGALPASREILATLSCETPASSLRALCEPLVSSLRTSCELCELLVS